VPYTPFAAAQFSQNFATGRKFVAGPDNKSDKGKGKLTDFFPSTSSKKRKNGDDKPESSSKRQKIQEVREAFNKNSKNMARKGYSGRSKSNRRNPRFTTPKGKKRSFKKKKRYVIVTKRQIKKWDKGAKNAKIDLATHHFIRRYTGQYTCGVNDAVYHGLLDENKSFGVLQLQQAFAKMKYLQLDAGTPTMVEINPLTPVGSALTVQQKFACQISTHIRFLNNYATPMWIDVYALVPKTNTAITPTTAYTAGLADQQLVSEPIDVNSVLAYPSWSKQLTTLYNTVKHTRVCLSPGESTTCSFKKKFQYDNSYYETHPFPMMAQYGSHVYAIRIQGTVGHGFGDGAPQLKTGSSECRIDTEMTSHVKIIYPGGFKGTIYHEEDHAPTPNPASIVVGWPSNCANTRFSIT